MSVGGLLRSSYLLYFSQPAADRTLLKGIKGQPIRSIVELGIGPAGRTEKVLEVAGWQSTSQPLRYTAIDLFEARPTGQPPLSLKQAFGNLRKTGAKVQLVPGDPLAALLRVANSLAGTDLLIVSSGHDPDLLRPAWKFVPRMVHPKTLVFLEESTGGKLAWRQLTPSDIERLAAGAGRLLRRAA
ncbi:MAG: hypothetical protein SFU86_02275 [Pirellulaceae bacterium]|nr:hypothetical protein [Pirellulaceae bacterium]